MGTGSASSPLPSDRDPVEGRPVSDEAAMGLALEEAAAATSHGDVPVGAVAVHDGAVIASRHNERELRGDPIAHAEVLVLSDAAAALGTWRLSEVTVVVTLEPCPMCAGGLVAARVGRLVFGAADPKAGACGSLYNLCADPRLNHEVQVTAGVRAGEVSDQLTAFFLERRSVPGSPDAPGRAAGRRRRSTTSVRSSRSVRGQALAIPTMGWLRCMLAGRAEEEGARRRQKMPAVGGHEPVAAAVERSPPCPRWAC